MGNATPRGGRQRVGQCWSRSGNFLVADSGEFLWLLLMSPLLMQGQRCGHPGLKCPKSIQSRDKKMYNLIASRAGPRQWPVHGVAASGRGTQAPPRPGPPGLETWVLGGAEQRHWWGLWAWQRPRQAGSLALGSSPLDPSGCPRPGGSSLWVWEALPSSGGRGC